MAVWTGCSFVEWSLSVGGREESLRLPENTHLAAERFPKFCYISFRSVNESLYGGHCIVCLIVRVVVVGVLVERGGGEGVESLESSTLDLVAVLGGVEVLHHLLVFLGNVGLGHPESRGARTGGEEEEEHWIWGLCSAVQCSVMQCSAARVQCSESAVQ